MKKTAQKLGIKKLIFLAVNIALALAAACRLRARE